MTKIMLALLVISSAVGAVSLGNAASRTGLKANDNCEIHYLDGQLVKCCPDSTGRWFSVPAK